MRSKEVEYRCWSLSFVYFLRLKLYGWLEWHSPSWIFDWRIAAWIWKIWRKSSKHWIIKWIHIIVWTEGRWIWVILFFYLSFFFRKYLNIWYYLNWFWGFIRFFIISKSSFKAFCRQLPILTIFSFIYSKTSYFNIYLFYFLY